jgi:hypothetical protein
LPQGWTFPNPENVRRGQTAPQHRARSVQLHLANAIHGDPTPVQARQRWLIWSVFLALWTFGLLYPSPPRLHTIDDIDEVRFGVAKTVHVSAYAILAILTGWLRVAPRYRWLMVFIIMAHGTATEMGQWATKLAGWSERTGELYDVAFDNVGIALGLLVSWKWWTAE